MKSLFYQFLSVLWIFFAGSVFSQGPDTLWTSSIGGSGSQAAYSIYPTPDGGFMLGGYTLGSGGGDFLMVRTDEMGQEIWTKTFGDADRYESASCMIKTSDGGYMLAGGRADDPPYSSNSDIFMVKSDDDGNFLWSSVIGLNDISESPNGIYQTDDGGYILCGHYWANSQTVYDIWLVKTDMAGNEQWNVLINLEDGKADYAHDVIQDADGGFVVTGETQAFSTNYDDNAYILKTDNMGNVIWLETYGGAWPWYESASYIIKTSDGGFFIGGNKDNDGMDKNWYVVKTDGSGTGQWSDNSIGGAYHDGAYAACEAYGGGFVVAGTYHEGTWNPCLARFSPEGDTVWTKMWGTGDDNSQYLFSVVQLEDGGYVTAGSTTTENDGLNVYVTRLHSDLVRIDEHSLSKESDPYLFNPIPNPFTDNTTISFQVESMCLVDISIVDVFGQKRIKLVEEQKTPGRYEVEVAGDNLPSGVYFCILTSGNHKQIQKLIHH